MRAITNAFDEYIVSKHIEEHYDFQTSIGSIFDAPHELSEESYESKSITFGCLVDANNNDTTEIGAKFPGAFLKTKKYKALSDGYRTAYYISNSGSVQNFVDLDKFDQTPLVATHYYPDWAEPLALSSRKRRIGIALSRQGDILVFDNGTLRFTYRYGQWQYWNHAHLINLLRDRTRAQKVARKILGRVVGTIYRAALDVSFRRSGGLFVILRRKKDLTKIVRRGDSVFDHSDRNEADREFDTVLANHTIQTLSRRILVELASLDGAIVVSNSGKILAYGAILQPKKSGPLKGTEGSRTKAAIGASNFGLAVKVSSDGDIVIYHEAKEFIRI